MTPISIRTAALIMGRTQRTIWRRIAEKALHPCGGQGNKTTVRLEDVIAGACIPLTDDDIDVIVRADRGEPDAQTDLALLFLAAGHPAQAIELLDLASARNYPEALYHLARVHINGTAGRADANTGLMWLARAAGAGHAIAIEQMKEVHRHGIGADLRALDDLLEHIDQRVVMDALRETADS